MNRPLVSILIPAYNHENFVVQCLNSALADPYPNKELVIIDDGSSDGTGAKIAAWTAKHGAAIKTDYVSRPNRGIAATLNELAQRANGEFLRLGASDDYFLPGGLQAQVDYLQAHPRKLAVIGDSVVVGKEGETLHASALSDLRRVKKAGYLSDDGIRREVVSRWAVGGPVTMIRKKAFESIGRWCEDLRIDDWSLFLRLVATDGLGFIDVKVSAYRIHGNNISWTHDTTARIANLGDAAKTARRHIALFDEPCKTLLRAQYYLIAAKIAFLKRNPFAVATNMLRFMLLSVAARMKSPNVKMPGAASGSAVP
jgi:glycosyltransferase involved in cell wall biosynthesis